MIMARNFLQSDASTDDFTAGADMTSAYKGNLTSVNPVTTRKDWMTIRNRLIGSRKDC